MDAMPLLMQILLAVVLIHHYGYAALDKQEVTNTETDEPKIWKDHVLPFEVDDSVVPTLKDNIMLYLKDWTDGTCLKAVRRTNQTDYIRFVPTNGSSECVQRGTGKKPGRNTISVGSACLNPGLFSRLVSGSLGVHKEITRADRDKFVTIQVRFIRAGEEASYTRITHSEASLIDTPYDYGSVTHFGETEYADPERSVVVQAVDARFRRAMGQQRGADFLDGFRYSQSNHCPPNPSLNCLNHGYSLAGKNKCICPSGFDGVDCNELTNHNMENCEDQQRNAEVEWKEINVSELRLRNRSPQTNKGTCSWMIIAPESKFVEFVIVNMTGPAGCDERCILYGLEVKSSLSERYAGSRHCCADDQWIGKPIFSRTRYVHLNYDIVYDLSNKMDNPSHGFYVKYRAVTALVTTPAPTTTTHVSESASGGACRKIKVRLMGKGRTRMQMDDLRVGGRTMATCRNNRNDCTVYAFGENGVLLHQAGGTRTEVSIPLYCSAQHEEAIVDMPAMFGSATYMKPVKGLMCSCT